MSRFRAYLLTLGGVIGAVLVTVFWVLPAAFGIQAGVVTSSSMAPDMPAHSLVLTRETQTVHVAVGDIVLFAAPRTSTPTMHRVVDIQPDGALVTKGDALGSVDVDVLPAGAPVRELVFTSFLAGWAITLAPWILGCLAAGVAASFLPRPRVASAVAMAGMLTVWAAAWVVASPAASVELLDKQSDSVTLVNTGLVSFTVEGVAGGVSLASVEVPPGTLGELSVPPGAAEVEYRIRPQWGVTYLCLLAVGFVLWLPSMWLARERAS